MRISQIKKLKRKKDVFSRFLFFLFFLTWVFFGSKNEVINFFSRIEQARAAVNPGVPFFYSNDGGANEIAFNNIRQNSVTPTFRVAATSTESFDRFQIELNASSTFTATAYTQTFSNTYSPSTAYNLTLNSLSPSLPTTDGVTYFARVRGSGDSGSTWGDWSTTTWAYTYKSSSGIADWFQTVNDQFTNGTLDGLVTSTSNSIQTTELLSGQYFTDFSEYTTGSLPSDWTRRWNTDGTDFIVREVAGASGGKVLRVEGDGTSRRRLVSWNVLDSASADVEFYYTVSTPATNRDFCMAARGSGSASSETGYRVGYNTASYTQEIARYSSGSFSRISSNATFSASVDTWYKGRVQIIGSNLKSKIWLATNSEPASWNLESTNTNITAAGWIGIFNFVSTASGGVMYGDFSVGLNGVAAPTSKGTTTGTIMSPEIDFSNAFNGLTWNEFNWSETETNGTIKTQLYYTNSTACDTIVPDGSLSGNSSGFSSGPVDISSLSTSTYSKLCLKSSLTDVTSTPYLNDWTVSWTTSTASSGSVVVSSVGSQVATLDIPSGGEYVGGAFSLVHSTDTTVNVTEITISQTGTVNGSTALDNIKLYYELDTTAPYDCNSVSYNGSEVQYGSTDTDGFSAGAEVSTFTGSVAVSSTQAMCVYTVLDVVDTANDGDTIEIEISDPSSDVVVSSGTVSPGSVVAISGTTNLNLPPNIKQVHYRWRNDNGYEDDFDTGDGADGSINLSANFNLNTESTGTYPDGVAYRVGAISGSNITLRNFSGSTLANTNGISAGDEILLINLQGIDGDYTSTGNYEFLEVQSVSGGVITVSSAPTKDYDGSGNSFSNQKVFVQRVPNYINVTTNAYDIIASSWDGGTDHDDSSCADNSHTGIVAFRANGIVEISASGSISVDGLGYQGGAGIISAGGPGFGYQGESASGTGSGLRGANLGGGGGGYNDVTGAGTSGASGAGGGYGTSGGAGDDSPEDTNSGGLAGGTYGDSSLSQIFLGSGGGGGGGDNDGTGAGTDGGSGGGIIFLSARYLNILGVISSNGSGSISSGNQYYGTGGAGSGGSIYLASASSTLGSSLVTASGGTGGCGSGSSYCGGDGGSGRIRIAISVYSGSTSPSASVTTTPTGQVTGATFAFAEDTPYTDYGEGVRKRLRFLINNEGSDAGSLNYTLQVAQHADCASGSYTTVPTDNSIDWKISGTSYIANGEATIDLGGVLSNPTSNIFVIGQLVDATNTIPLSLATSNFSEIEFSIESVTGNVDPGTQYCFRLVTDSPSVTYTNYAIANVASAAGDLTSDIVDSGGSTVTSPILVFTTSSFSFSYQSVTSTLGTSEQKIRVSNQSASAPWTLTIAATSTTALWTGISNYYDFNDSTSLAQDGGDADSYGGQMTIDPSVATITPQVGCSLTGLTLGGSASFSEGVTDSITLLSASGSASTNCYWDLLGVGVLQTIPSEQSSGNYTLDMVITVTAI